MKNVIAALMLSLALIGTAFGAQTKPAPAPAKTPAKPKTEPKTEKPAATPAAPVDDAAVTAAVKDKLSKTPSLKDAAINVETKGGVVTLTGTVKTVGLKGVATNSAKRVKGVKSVTNQLAIEKGGQIPKGKKESPPKKEAPPKK